MPGALVLYGLPALLVLWLAWTVLSARPMERGRRALTGVLLLPCLVLLVLNQAFGSGGAPAWIAAAPAPLFGLCALLLPAMVIRSPSRGATVAFGVVCLVATGIAALVAHMNLNQAFL